MKKILMLLLLASSMSTFAQAPYDPAPIENEEDIISSEESFEIQEDVAYPTSSESNDDYIAEEEVYDSESDYND